MPRTPIVVVIGVSGSGNWIDGEIAVSRPAIVACSALKRRYRDVLRRPEVVFVLLDADAQTLAHRMAERPGHFMPAALLASQMGTLERPGPDEQALTVATDAGPADIVDELVERLGLETGTGPSHRRL